MIIGKFDNKEEQIKQLKEKIAWLEFSSRQYHKRDKKLFYRVEKWLKIFKETPRKHSVQEAMRDIFFLPLD